MGALVGTIGIADRLIDDLERSFQLDVMPVLTSSGCNTGSCHGSARGQDGFHLSLYGFDPKGDHFRLTTEMAGRRINNALPEESLLVTKAIDALNHASESHSDGAGLTRKAIDADNKVSTAEFDANGNRLKARDANGIGLDCIYDKRNRDNGSGQCIKAPSDRSHHEVKDEPPK